MTKKITVVKSNRKASVTRTEIRKSIKAAKKRIAAKKRPALASV